MAIIIAFSLLPTGTVAADNCAGIKLGQKIYWDGIPMTSGQIGKLAILQDTPLFSFVDGEVMEAKLLNNGSTYRIYNFKTGYVGVGGGYYVKRDAKVSYKTPSKQKLLDVKCAFPIKNNGSDVPVIPSVNPINLGSQVSNLSTIASRAGMDNEGNAYLYMILHGTPASLAVIDLNTNQVIKVYNLENSTSAWALDVDNDGILWIGGTTDGNLYSYNPNTEQLKDYGNVLDGKSDTSIQGLVVNDQYVYSSTAYGANVVAFNKKTEKKEFILPTDNGKIAKSIAVDPENQNVYVSSGPSADLFKWDLTFKVKSSFITDNYRNESYADNMKWIDGFLAMKFYPSKKAAIYSISSGAFLNEFTVDSKGFSAKDNQTNEFYYTYQAGFYAYNLDSGTIRKTNATLPSKKNALSLDFVQLKDNPSQKVLTGLIDNKGSYYLYNPVTNKLITKTVTLPFQPVDLYTLFSDPEMRYVYANGFMTGGLTQYDPLNNTSIQLSGVNQLESVLFVNGKLYAGAYPSARLMELTPKQSWDQTTVKELISLNQFGQERITALANSNNHLFAGTYSQDTKKGGLLLDYDLNSGQYKVYEDFVTNQSIISLLSDGQYIYGGTSVHANYRVAEFKAKFFRYNPQNPNEKEFIYLPVMASMVMSLIKGPDGEIWGAADGTIFAYNPDSNTFRQVQLLKAISGNFGNANLLVGKDGFIYGTIEGHLFKLNPSDMSYQFLLESGAYQIAQDVNGNLYYRNKDDLYKLPIEDTKILSNK
jgi:hypothetical protein